MAAPTNTSLKAEWECELAGGYIAKAGNLQKVNGLSV
jgi:hypothetical protein